MKSAYALFDAGPGWMGLVGNEKGIERIYLPGLSKEDLRKRIQREFPESGEDSSFFRGAQKEFLEYFQGRRKRFEFPLDLSRATPFQRKVYKVMSGISFGEIRTYRWLAQMTGYPKGFRAVGSANARNRWPIVIPCHRIVGSDGRLTGFSAPGGLNLKAMLLKLEGIAVEEHRVKFKAP